MDFSKEQIYKERHSPYEQVVYPWCHRRKLFSPCHNGNPPPWFYGKAYGPDTKYERIIANWTLCYQWKIRMPSSLQRCGEVPAHGDRRHRPDRCRVPVE